MSDSRVILVQEEPRGPSMLMEVVVDTNGQSKITLPVLATLRNDTTQNIIVKGLNLITAEVLARAPVKGTVNAPLAELQKMSLVLYSQGWLKGLNIPVLRLNDQATPGGTFPHRYHPTKFNNWTQVDWEQSFLQYSNGSTSANAPYTVIFEIDYLKLNVNGGEINGLS